mgnify:CR=1 FL=1
MGNEIIKHKREELGLSQSALGKIIGISQQHIDRYEKGYPVPLDKILLFSEKLGISKWELLPENFRPQETGQIYRIGYVQAGKFNEACQLPENEWEAIPYPINNIYKKANIFALGVKGDSMNLVFPPERTTLICCPLEDWLEANPGTDIEGKYIIAYRHTPDGLCEATVKKYTKIDDSTIILVAESTNPEIKPIVLHPDSNEYEIAAVVIGDMRVY